MTARTKQYLKARFQNGVAVSAGDYADLIDSFFNISETSAQSITGSLNVDSASITSIDSENVSAQTITSLSSAQFSHLEVGNLYRSTEASAIPTGTSQASALSLTKDMTRFVDVSSSFNAARLSSNQGISQIVFNDTNVNLSVYPPVGSKINALSTNSPYVVSASVVTRFYSVSGPTYFTG
jgi:hypothetical protein